MQRRKLAKSLLYISFLKIIIIIKQNIIHILAYLSDSETSLFIIFPQTQKKLRIRCFGKKCFLTLS